MDIDEKVLKELAKQLPVKELYSDAVQPPAKQVGKLAEDIMKVLRLALFPITFGAGLQDRYEAFIKKSVARVPEEKRVSPAPQILGPVLEGIRYEPEGTPIDEMFSELLSTSMDRERLNDAHPSFPSIIKQLSSDEAKILRKMFTSGAHPRIVQIFQLKGPLSITSTERNELPIDGLSFPGNISMYTDRLIRLGLIQLHAEKGMEPIFSNGIQTGGRNFLICKFSETGESFMRACVGKDQQRFDLVVAGPALALAAAVHVALRGLTRYPPRSARPGGLGRGRPAPCFGISRRLPQSTIRAAVAPVGPATHTGCSRT